MMLLFYSIETKPSHNIYSVNIFVAKLLQKKMKPGGHLNPNRVLILLKGQNRADVIEYWLRDHGFGLDSTKFVVIDDDAYSDLQRFGERFIRTYDLFREEHLEQASKVLKIENGVSHASANHDEKSDEK